MKIKSSMDEVSPEKSISSVGDGVTVKVVSGSVSVGVNPSVGVG